VEEPQPPVFVMALLARALARTAGSTLRLSVVRGLSTGPPPLLLRHQQLHPSIRQATAPVANPALTWVPETTAATRAIVGHSWYICPSAVRHAIIDPAMGPDCSAVVRHAIDPKQQSHCIVPPKESAFDKMERMRKLRTAQRRNRRNLMPKTKAKPKPGQRKW